MPEIFVAGQSYAIDAMRAKGPASLAERGFKPVEIGESSEALFERGAEVVRFINQVAIGRDYRLPTTHFFWTEGSNGSETVFVKTPIGDSETNNKSVLLMFRASKELREQIQLEFMQKPTRESIRDLMKSLLDASGNQVQDSDLFVSTIAYMTTPANNMILQATQQRQAAFNVNVGMQFAGDIDVRHLPHKMIIPDSTSIRSVQTETVAASPTHIQTEPFRSTERDPNDVLPQYRRPYMENQNVHTAETADESELREIDLHVADRHIEGKFRGEVIIHGQHVTPPTYNRDGGRDYEMHPHDGVLESMYKYSMKFDPSRRIVGFLEACYQDARNDREGTTSSYRKTPQELKFGDSLSFVHFQESEDKNTTHLFIQAPNADYDFSSRPTWFAKLCCSLPTGDWEKLQSLIKSNPVNAERFVQIAFEGLDNSTWRIPIDRVSIIDIDKYIPMSVLNGPQITGNIDYAMRQLAAKKLIDISAVETIPYPKKLPEIVT